MRTSIPKARLGRRSALALALGAATHGVALVEGVVTTLTHPAVEGAIATAGSALIWIMGGAALVGGGWLVALAHRGDSLGHRLLAVSQELYQRALADGFNAGFLVATCQAFAELATPHPPSEQE